MSFFETLSHLMEDRGMKPTQLSEILHFGKNQIKYWEKNGNIPNGETLISLADYFNCSVDYLLGRTHNFTQSISETALKDHPENKSATELMNNIENNAKAMNIKGLHRLSDYSDDLIVNPAYISKHPEADNLIEFVDAADAAQLSSKHNLIIPFFENAVSAGVGEEFITDAEHFIRIPQTYKKLHADYAVRISGNSMEPEYFDGDILLVRFQEQLEPGELGIFIANNMMYFKKLGEGRLISLNPDFDDLRIDAGFNPVVQGKVISKLKK